MSEEKQAEILPSEQDIKTLKAQMAWCIESIKILADAINNKKEKAILRDEPPTGTDPPT